MQHLGIIGYPLAHTLSPLFQQAALDHYGLDVQYQVWETLPDRVGDVVASLRRPERLGMNVTVPHKEAVAPFLDRFDVTAEAIGAVNTVVKQDGQLAGYNTDCTGFLRALQADGGYNPSGVRALVLGAGGAARAVAYALLEAEVSFLGIAARRLQQSRALRSSFNALAQQHHVTVFTEEWATQNYALAVPTYDLIVNTTTMGMRHNAAEGESPLTGVNINTSSFVYDLVYNPEETPLLRQAQQAGCRTLGGLPMLVYQGAAAFELWTGKDAPIEVMRTAAQHALASRQ